jgi:hypothetical protein
MLASIQKPITTVVAALLLVPAVATAQIRERRGTPVIYDQSTPEQGTMLIPTPMASGPPPTGLTVTGTQTTATLSWTAPAGATGFDVWRAVTNQYPTKLTATPVTTPSFVDQTGFGYGLSYSYRVESHFAGGPSGSASVSFQPPQPVNPAWVRANVQTLQGQKEIAVSWDSVPGATRYHVFGPSEAMFRDVAAPASYVVLKNPPPGTYTIAVAAVFGNNEMRTPDNTWPRASVTVPASGRYRIILNGAQVISPTTDDPLSRDGKGDEVQFINVVEVFDRMRSAPSRKQWAMVPQPKNPWATYGDVSVDRNRMQAGTLSGSGGLGAGDWIPMGVNVFTRYAPPAAVGLPMLLWEGMLTDGEEALLVHPAVSEVDPGTSDAEFFHSSTLCPPNLLFDTPAVTQHLLSPGIGAPIVVPIRSAKSKCLRSLEFTFHGEVDRAIGYGDPRPVGLLAGTNDPNAYISADAYVVLTREKIESALGGQSWKVVRVDRVDQFRGGNGHYALYLLIERVP